MITSLTSRVRDDQSSYSSRRGSKVKVPLTAAICAILLVAALIAVVRLGTPDADPDPVRPTDVLASEGRSSSSPRRWLSGAWTGFSMSAANIDDFGSWRGSPADVVTTYPAFSTWAEMRQASFHVRTFDGFQGRLVYGLPLLPSREPASLEDVAQGKHDDVWRAIASTLDEAGRGDSFVRVGLEANGSEWSAWGATARTAAAYRAAFRQVVGVVRPILPDAEFVFDISCGVDLEGGTDRMAALTELYPGDDVVDVIGCDHYDSWTAKARTAEEWRKVIEPEDAPGLADVVAFARAQRKAFAVPEWGLTAASRHGGGDNPFFIGAMHQFFVAHEDVLAFECYFNEADSYLASSIWREVQHPKASALYRALWSAPRA